MYGNPFKVYSTRWYVWKEQRGYRPYHVGIDPKAKPCSMPRMDLVEPGVYGCPDCGKRCPTFAAQLAAETEQAQNPKEPKMPAAPTTTHTFTLTLKVPAHRIAGLTGALFKAGCDDALLGSSGGRLYLDFDRESVHDLADTIRDATQEVESTGVQVTGVRFGTKGGET